MMTLSPLHEQPVDWPSLIEQYEQSGLQQKQFCQANQLSVRQFKYQRAKLKSQSVNLATLPLIPIHIKTTPVIKPEEPTALFQITFNNGIYCQIPLTVAAEKLKHLMEVLQAC